MDKKNKKIHLVAAARPNFMKIAPLYHELRRQEWAAPEIIHTGQHYDINMSASFFRDLALPEPTHNLEVGSGTHAEQTGMVMIAYEKVLKSYTPDLVIVVGDVNSTMAAAIASVKLGIRTAHLEAGLRSFDRSMPEEINRVITDSISDILWTPSIDGDENLQNEGISREKIFRVGNIMIDSFEMLRKKIEDENTLNAYDLKKGNFGLVTLHRPGNVDDSAKLAKLVDLLITIGDSVQLIFPVHPRTRKKLEANGLWRKLHNSENVKLTEPLNYIQFMNLAINSRIVITDSGGIQEETTYLGIPCLTLRPNTERPITIKEGTNQLCDLDNLQLFVREILNGNLRNGKKPELWDGNTAKRITESIKQIMSV